MASAKRRTVAAKEKISKGKAGSAKKRQRRGSPKAPKVVPYRPPPNKVQEVVPYRAPAAARTVVEPKLPSAAQFEPRGRQLAEAVSGEPLVVAKRVSRIYSTSAGQVVALAETDFLVRKGEMVAVMGPSGSGKTTLLNCLSGLDEVTSGEVVVEGTSLKKMSDAERTQYRARRMGFVFQAFNLLPVFSAVENVELPLLLGGTKASESRKRALEALDLVGLSQRGSHRPSELSAGEQQRVAIARAIAPRPAVLWADEPTGNLDSDNAAKVIDLMRSLNKREGLTIVLVTHDPEVAEDAGRLVMMRDGRIYDGDGPGG